MYKWIVVFCIAFQSLLSAELHVLGFSGSTREASVNKKLVKEALRLAEEKGDKITYVDLKNFPLPLFDGDLEAKEGMPKAAAQLAQLVAENQLIIISTPDYNASISGVLKNTLDWLSRSKTRIFKDKRFFIMTATPSTNNEFKALGNLREIITRLGGKIAGEFSLPAANNAFDANGRLKAPQKLKLALQNIT